MRRRSTDPTSASRRHDVHRGRDFAEPSGAWLCWLRRPPMLWPIVSLLLLILLRSSLRLQYAVDVSEVNCRSMSIGRSLIRRRPALSWSAVRNQSTAHAPFSYRLGASSSGKSSPLTAPNKNNCFNHALMDGDEPYFSSVSRYSGEDAFFMAQVARSPRHVVFGVADGVGGWRDSGIDPGKYSHGLCKYMATRTRRPESERDLNPRELLQHAYESVTNDKSIQAGGCTACIGALHPSGVLDAAK